MENSISLVDYVGVENNGIVVELSFLLNEILYQIFYWFDKNNNFKLVIEEKFYTDYNTESIYDMPHFNDLIGYIDYVVLPPRNDIFKQFNLL